MLFVYVFNAEKCDGEPQETAEAAPIWTPLDTIPFELFLDVLGVPAHYANKWSFPSRIEVIEGASSCPSRRRALYDLDA